MAIPHHFFVTTADGDLHDLRLGNDWTKYPVRRNYRRHHWQITSVADLKATLRAGDAIWPGGYPLFFLTSDNATLSFETVRAEFRTIAASIRDGIDDGWRVTATAVNWEDDELTDDHSGELIECAYPDDRTADYQGPG